MLAAVAAVGTRHVDDNFYGFGGFSGLRVAGCALHDALAVEQELRNVGESGGVAPSDTAIYELFQQVSEKKIYGCGSGQIFYAL